MRPETWGSNGITFTFPSLSSSRDCLGRGGPPQRIIKIGIRNICNWNLSRFWSEWKAFNSSNSLWYSREILMTFRFENADISSGKPVGFFSLQNTEAKQWTSSSCSWKGGATAPHCRTLKAAGSTPPWRMCVIVGIIVNTCLIPKTPTFVPRTPSVFRFFRTHWSSEPFLTSNLMELSFTPRQCSTSNSWSFGQQLPIIPNVSSRRRIFVKFNTSKLLKSQPVSKPYNLSGIKLGPQFVDKSRCVNCLQLCKNLSNPSSTSSRWGNSDEGSLLKSLSWFHSWYCTWFIRTPKNPESSNHCHKILLSFTFLRTSSKSFSTTGATKQPISVRTHRCSFLEMTQIHFCSREPGWPQGIMVDCLKKKERKFYPLMNKFSEKKKTRKYSGAFYHSNTLRWRQFWVPIPWASYQIGKIAGCADAGNAGNIFPATDFKGNR